METAASSPLKTHIVLDLGKKKKKQLKKLRKGKGKLMAKVDATIAELEQDGTIQPGSVVVVLATKKKKSKGLLRMLV